MIFQFEVIRKIKYSGISETAKASLAKRDWLILIAWIAAGLSSSYLILHISTALFLEPLMVSESSLRIAKNVQLVEEVLKHLSIEDLPSGLIIKQGSNPPSSKSFKKTRDFDRLLSESLSNERGLKRTIVPDADPLIDPLGGHWIRLQTSPSKSSVWLYQADRLSSSLWFMGPLRVITLALGMMGGIVLFLRQQLIIPISIITASLPDGSNRTAKLIAEQGMTPVRSLCVSVNRLLERINASEEERRSFIRGLVHDLGSPTTRMGLRLEEFEQENQGENRNLVISMTKDLDQLSQLVDQLRIIASNDTFQTGLQEAALDDLCHRVSDRYKKEHIQLQVPRIIVRMDVSGFERSLCNLIDNALEYGKPPVLVEIKSNKNGLRIMVDDQGMGIATPTLLTMPYHSRSNDRQRIRHQGLGLTIVEAFCRQHDGEMGLSRSPLGGLRVTLTLPAGVVVRPTQQHRRNRGRKK